jgi:hypothetical protein
VATVGRRWVSGAAKHVVIALARDDLVVQDKVRDLVGNRPRPSVPSLDLPPSRFSSLMALMLRPTRAQFGGEYTSVAILQGVRVIHRILIEGCASLVPGYNL